MGILAMSRALGDLFLKPYVYTKAVASATLKPCYVSTTFLIWQVCLGRAGSKHLRARAH